MALTKITGNVLENNLEIPSVSSINDGPLAGFRNVIINGNFDIWQRATIYTGAGQGYRTTDRWIAGRDGGSGASATLSRQEFTPGQTDVPGNPRYFFRWAETNAGSGYNGKYFYQNIEGADTFAGQQVTFSFYAKAASPVTLPGIFWYRYFDSATEDDFANIAPNVSVGTSWQKYTYTFTLPSVSGKTIGSNSALNVYPEVPVTGTFTLDFAQFQLELGPVATPFERRPIGTELALCQRYFEIISMQSLTGTAGNTTRVAFNRPYTVSKRANPNISVFSGTNTNFNVYRPGLESVNSGIAIFINNSFDGAAFSIEIGTFSALTNNQSWTGRFQEGKFAASAEL
jgi:hypothetical protein